MIDWDEESGRERVGRDPGRGRGEEERNGTKVMTKDIL